MPRVIIALTLLFLSLAAHAFAIEAVYIPADD